MARVLAVNVDQFHNQVFQSGTKRGTPKEIFDEHGAQINLTQHPPGLVVKPHAHTVDEILYLLDGELLVDGVGPLPKGSALVFGANNVYGFTVGSAGVRWLAIRPTRPDLPDLEKTDATYDLPKGVSNDRSHVVSGAQVGKMRWRQLPGRFGIKEKALVTAKGSAHVSLFNVAGGATHSPPPTGNYQFLFVLNGTITVDGQPCPEQTAVSIPPGAAPAIKVEGGPATYVHIEAADQP